MTETSTLDVSRFESSVAFANVTAATAANKVPLCLKAKVDKINESYEKIYGKKKNTSVNNRLVHSLFLRGDAEEIVSILSDFDYTFNGNTSLSSTFISPKKDEYNSQTSGGDSIYAVLAAVNDDITQYEAVCNIQGKRDKFAASNKEQVVTLPPQSSPSLIQTPDKQSVDKIDEDHNRKIYKRLSSFTPSPTRTSIVYQAPLATLLPALPSVSSPTKLLSSSSLPDFIRSPSPGHSSSSSSSHSASLTPTKDKRSSNSVSSSTSSLQKGWLPSLDGSTTIPLSPNDESRYFGAAAKVDFFDHFKAMNRHKLIFQGTEAAAATTIRSSHTLSDMSSAISDSYTASFKDQHRHADVADDNTTINTATVSVVASGTLHDDLYSVVDDELVSQYSSNYFSTGRVSSQSSKLKSSRERNDGNYASSNSDDDATGDDIEVNNQDNSVVDNISIITEHTDEAMISPRTKFIGGCIRDGLVPRPNCIIRSTLSTKLSLPHYGIGDAFGRILAESIAELPNIESIDLNDNGLTDDSLQHLVLEMMKIPTLKELNLSRNKVDGDCSESLAKYLSDEECPLLSLVLQGADVDDGECYNFIEAIATNRKSSLQLLDLSYNKIGTANTASNAPNGVVALALYLTASACKLDTLKLSWNSIKGDNGAIFVKSLANNSSITYLDLSFNGLGSKAGEALGDSLMNNKILRHLNVSNNSLGNSAVFTICTAIKENFSMKYINMNDNPIGYLGASSLLQIPIKCGTRIDVSATNCNCTVKDECCWFDFLFPCRRYTLKLSNEFERAVAYTVLNIAADHESYILQSAQYTSSTGSKEELKLVQITLSDKETYFDTNQIVTLGKLRKLLDAASDINKARKLFDEADSDGSGALDFDEVTLLLESVGLDSSSNQVAILFNTYDLDGAGSIEIDEFMQFLNAQKEEATQRIDDMLQYHVMAIDIGAKSTKYIPPKEGILSLHLVDGYKKKLKKQTISSCDQENMSLMAKKMGDVSITSSALSNAKLRYTEALQQYKNLFGISGNMCDSVSKVLPLIADANDVRQLLSYATKDVPSQLAQVKKTIGYLLQVILGPINGYYVLNLSKDIDRFCMSKLFEQSMKFNNKRMNDKQYFPNSRNDSTYAIGDVSQHCNWSCFRNCYYKNQPIELSIEKFSPIPSLGVLEFDYSCQCYPEYEEMIITDDRYVKVLMNLSIVTNQKEEDVHTTQAMQQLMQWKKRSMVSEEKKMSYSQYYCDVQSSNTVSLGMDQFYDNLTSRRSEYVNALELEEVKVDYLTEYSNLPDSRQLVNSIASGNTGGGNISNSIIFEQKKRLHALLVCQTISDNAKAARVAEAVIDVCSKMFVRSRHVALLVEYFTHTYGSTLKTESFGSYICEVVCSIFCKIVDLHNFDIVLSVLSPSDIACIYCRIGMLCIYNPAKPDGALELNLSRNEERRVAKIIITLADIEPGINIPIKSFQWDRETEGMGGFEITEPWLTEEGLPKKGYLRLVYYSGDNVGKSGCKPDYNTRMALLNMVLIDEKKIVVEDDHDSIVDIKAIEEISIQHYHKNYKNWLNLLA